MIAGVDKKDKNEQIDLIILFADPLIDMKGDAMEPVEHHKEFKRFKD